MLLMRDSIRRLINHELNQYAYNVQQLTSRGQAAVFQVEMTNHCPMTCVMCPRTYAMTRGRGFMDEALYQRIISSITGSTPLLILHHFGESLLHPKLGSFIRYASDHSIKTYLSVNPALLDETRARALVDNGLYELAVSVDGVTDETFIAIRGPAAGSVALAEQRVRWLLEYRDAVGARIPRVCVQLVRQRRNLHEVHAWLDKWQQVPGVDKVCVKEYCLWDGRGERISSQRPDAEVASERGKPIVCEKPWTSVAILWDGRVVPCCFDYDGLCVLGDLRHESLQDIWNGDRMQSLRRYHRDRHLQQMRLCAECVDREGYPVRKWYYPLNRWFAAERPLAGEWKQPQHFLANEDAVICRAVSE